MLQATLCSAGVFPGLAWAAFNAASPAVSARAAGSKGWRLASWPRMRMGANQAMAHTASMPAAHSATDTPSAQPQPPPLNEDAPTAAPGEPGSAAPVVPHPGMSKASVAAWAGAAGFGVPVDVSTVMQNPVYSREYMEGVRPVHIPPKELHQRLAFRAISTIRRAFDIATGYHPDRMDEAQWLRRIIFLETVAGVPGMVGGMLRHLRSLRLMTKDNGWINTLLEEAENERMHLLTFMEMRQPGWLFRSSVIVAQGVMFNLMFAAYLLSPKFCHSLVGYLEEEAVKTYTHAIKDVDAGRLWPGQAAPPIAQAYWRLPPGASMRDLLLAVRADEACHSHVNHTFAALPQDEVNPFTGKGGSAMP